MAEKPDTTAIKRNREVDGESDQPSQKKTKREPGEAKESEPTPADEKQLMREQLEKLLEDIEIKPENLILDDPRKPEEVFGLVKRSEVHMTREFGEVVLSEFENIDCDGAPVIESFPSIGLVGVLTGKQIVKSLKLPLIGVIQLQNLEAACVVSHEQPSYPARIYGNKTLVVFLCEMAFRVPPDAIQSVVQCIYDFTHRHRSPMLYALEGMPKPHVVQLPTGEEVEIRLDSGGDDDDEDGCDSDDTNQNLMLIDDSTMAKLAVREHLRQKDENKSNTEPEKKEAESSGKTKAKKKQRKRKSSGGEEETEEAGFEKLADKLFGDKLHYVSTDHGVAKKLRTLGHIPVLDGIIPGVVGALVAEAALRRHPEVTALLAPTSLLFPDPDAAIQVLKLLDTLHPGLSLDKAGQELEKDVASLKKMMQGLMRKLSTDLGNNVAGGLRGSRSGIPSGMYQ
eukprot:TRINITY_DN1416_c0_g2_i4.p1 TRINITY_DN1416_c0_g2~~TRINITY_DN1416_c0_g2_i4.p1  ORF type:complete len:453 (+),score=126.04 TRINITY_DN1416_c0_g2_i4:73-1431(+)